MPRPSGPVLGGSGRSLPYALLGALCIVMAVLHLVWISTPRQPIFDETYYVNAARIIDGTRPAGGATYSRSPLGLDPNREHPPLGKVMIAASIGVLGDRPLGWRLPSVLASTAALIALFWLARTAGAGPWTALSASSVMAVEQLFFVHGWIGTLDMLVLPFMIAAVALYLKGRHRWAALVIGLGACIKTIAVAALAVIVILELMDHVSRRSSAPTGEAEERGRTRARRIGTCSGLALLAYLAVLGVLDWRYTNFDNPVAHTRHIVGYATDEHTESQPRRPGLAAAPSSGPLDWLLNQEPILYHQQFASSASDERVVFFEGRMSPAVIFLALPALAFAGVRWWRRGEGTSRVVVAWCLGVFACLVVVSLGRDFSYLYYMLAVIPGMCLGVAAMMGSRWLPRPLAWCFGAALLYGFWTMFPIRSAALG